MPGTATVNPEGWKRSILSLVQEISNAKAGMALLRSIQLAANWIQVQPTHDGRCSAHGSAIARVTPSKKNVTGVVSFDPASYMKSSHCYQLKNRARANRGFAPKEVFFHELIHAHRGSLRLSLKSPDGQPLGGGWPDTRTRRVPGRRYD